MGRGRSAVRALASSLGGVPSHPHSRILLSAPQIPAVPSRLPASVLVIISGWAPIRRHRRAALKLWHRPTRRRGRCAPSGSMDQNAAAQRGASRGVCFDKSGLGCPTYPSTGYLPRRCAGAVQHLLTRLLNTRITAPRVQTTASPLAPQAKIKYTAGFRLAPTLTHSSYHTSTNG